MRSSSRANESVGSTIAGRGSALGAGRTASGRVSRRNGGGRVDGKLEASMVFDRGGGGGAELRAAFTKIFALDRGVADPTRRKGTGGVGFAGAISWVVVEVLPTDGMRCGGGRGFGGFGGGGGLGLMSAFQSIFLLGWLCMRSRVLVILVDPASATFAALLRSSSMDVTVGVRRYK